MTQGPLLRGARVSLRHLDARDRESSWTRPRQPEAARPLGVCAADAEAFAGCLRRTKAPDLESLLVCREEDERHRRRLQHGQIFYGPFCSAYLGYYGFTPFAGQGYMREGLQLVLRYAFGPLGLHRLEANIQPENRASIALVSARASDWRGSSPRYLKIAGRWRITNAGRSSPRISTPARRTT